MNREQMTDYYRDRAAWCRELAESANNPRDAEEFKIAAREWERLALHEQRIA